MDLLDRWTALAGPEARVLGERLVARYSEEHRRYHDREHLVAVLDMVDELARFAADPDLVRLAAWFHDAVYDPARADNEKRSARLARCMLADTDLTPDAVEEVARLVELTESHAPDEDDRNGRVLCDADLAVLGSDPERYAAYAAAVREEYSFVPDEVFKAGRARILRSLLDLPVLFHTPTARARFEERARKNISTELTLLEG
ncbi:hypothetical protein Arub01_05690 [Actinomadura rubrobrunea]|uniref:HD domain-containing protein n=1 Tax=Actinomadura rubrobrunea TaxID=115335 RepID=A0A9W6PRQ2_9ACTN|nr:HD domain-containing protein [Actinomadura rubrobrunea]GLW62325.1 hypothetical protein Arub01_05690 [Actinomadura rubrobrunea]